MVPVDLLQRFSFHHWFPTCQVRVDLNRDRVSSVFRACAQCSAPDLNRDPVRPVFRAGPQPRSCEFSVPRRTSTAILWVQCSSVPRRTSTAIMWGDMSERMSENMSERMSEDMSERMWKYGRDASSKALVLSGPPGTGKTELGMAVLLSLTSAVHFVSKLELLRTLTVTRNQSLLVDEVTLQSCDCDDAKAWVDICRPGHVKNRCQDWFILGNTIRCFTANHALSQFFPREYFGPHHKEAFDRRVAFVHIHASVTAWGADRKQNVADAYAKEYQLWSTCIM